MAVREQDDFLWKTSPVAEIRRYALAALTVLAVSAGPLFFISQRQQGTAASDIEDAVLLDLPPALASSIPKSEVADGPEQQMADAVAPIAKPDYTNPVKPPPEPQTPQDPPMPIAERQPEVAELFQQPPLAVPKPDESKSKSPAAEKMPEKAAPPTAGAAAQEEMAPSDSRAPAKEAEPIDSDAARSHSTREISRWQRTMLTRLEAAKSGIQSSGLSGTVNVGFTIDRKGHVVSSHIVHSSGSQRLDQAALELLKRASPFPNPPTRALDEALTFTVPIAFTHRR